MTVTSWLAAGLIVLAIAALYLGFGFYDALKRLDVVLDLSRAGRLTEPHDHELFGVEQTGGTR